MVLKMLQDKLIKVSRAVYLSRRYSTKVVRVRFAPSPTGYLHLGGLRTALYNFLFAQKYGGKFVLRIEDTDQTRAIEGAAKALQDDLNWAGVQIDEGPEIGGTLGPYTQSERQDLYRKQVEVLIQNGSAYRCFCTERRLNLLRKEAVRSRQVPKYDNRCRHMTPEEVETRINRQDKHCIRFKLLPDCETFEDLIYGNIAYDVALNEGDPVIMKSDGYPTYHFANVVDDHLMNISHVLRGVEWQISTTKHILMYRAFGWEPPLYGHLPLLMNADGTKLSKRQGDIRIANYRDNGVYPLALINFITSSGGGFEKDLERGIKSRLYSMEELAEQFDIEKINLHSGRLMPEKLVEFNRLELTSRSKEESTMKVLVKDVKRIVKEQFPESPECALQLDESYISTILKWSLNRIGKLTDLVSKDLRFLWVVPEFSAVEVNNKQIDFISSLRNTLDDLQFDKNNVNQYLKQLASDNGVKFEHAMALLRTVLSGLKEGPSVAEMIIILGEDNTRRRLEMFLN